MLNSEAVEESPTVFVVDDDDSVRRGLERLLRSAGYRAETFGSAIEFLDSDPGRRKGCLVLDVRLPGLDGLDLQQELAARQIQIPIIFITGHGDVPMSVRAMKAGALDFLPKPFEESELLQAIERGLKRDAQTRGEGAIVDEIERRLGTLTAREKEVFELVVTGMLNKQIGAQLGIAEKTVKVHRGRVMTKVGATSLAELVRFSERLRTAGK